MNFKKLISLASAAAMLAAFSGGGTALAATVKTKLVTYTSNESNCGWTLTSSTGSLSDDSSTGRIKLSSGSGSGESGIAQYTVPSHADLDMQVVVRFSSADTYLYFIYEDNTESDYAHLSVYGNAIVTIDVNNATGGSSTIKLSDIVESSAKATDITSDASKEIKAIVARANVGNTGARSLCFYYDPSKNDAGTYTTAYTVTTNYYATDATAYTNTDYDDDDNHYIGFYGTETGSESSGEHTINWYIYDNSKWYKNENAQTVNYSGSGDFKFGLALNGGTTEVSSYSAAYTID